VALSNGELTPTPLFNMEYQPATPIYASRHNLIFCFTAARYLPVPARARARRMLRRALLFYLLRSKNFDTKQNMTTLSAATLCSRLRPCLEGRRRDGMRRRFGDGSTVTRHRRCCDYSISCA